MSCSKAVRKHPTLVRALAVGVMLLLGGTGWLAPSPASAQSYMRKQWTVEDGLPSNAVHHLLQTRDGYLWLATADGLVRFDGVRFTVFNTGNADGLPGNRILSLHEDAEGNLWLITETQQLVRFREGTFTHFGENNGLPGIFTGVLYQDDEGTLWIGTNQGVARYRNGQIQRYRPDVIDAHVSALLRDAVGNLWIGTAGRGLSLLRPDGTVEHFTTDNGLQENFITHLYEDRYAVVWAGTPKGISHRFGQGFMPLLKNEAPWETSVLSMHQDTTDTYWLATENGWFTFQDEQLVPFHAEEQGRFERAPHARQEQGGHLWINTRQHLYRDGERVFEAEDAITTVLPDREGNVWVATTTEGLLRLRSPTFTTLGVPEGLPGNNVYSILQDRSGSVWLGTLNHGLARLRGETAVPYTIANGRLLTNAVWSIYEDRDGTLWVGGAGLYRMAGGRFVRSPLPPNASDVRALYEDRRGGFWVGTEHSLFLRNPGAGDSTWTRLNPEGIDLSQKGVRFFYETRDGSLWLGLEGGGLARYQNGGFTPFTSAQGLCSDRVSTLYEDPDGILWVGAENQGLCRIDRQGADPLQQATVTPIRMRDGLFDNSIRHMLEDDQGRLWMSTSRGIFWVERALLNAFAAGTAPSVRSVVYTERDGMRSREANGGGQPAGLKARDGRLWFPTRYGAVVVDPAVIEAPQAPPVAIEAVWIGDALQPPGSHLTVSSRRDITIAYTALTFFAPETVNFRYRLEGFETDWHEAGARRTATYTDVPPGTYTFRVVAGFDGAWSDEGTTLTITRSPRFFETPWFVTLCGLLVLLGLVGIYRYRMRQLEARTQVLEQKVAERTAEVEIQKNQLEAQNAQLRQNKSQLVEQAAQLKQLDELKTRFFANISHEFRTPLTLLLGPLKELLNKTHGALSPEADDQIDLAYRNGQRLLDLINKLLDLSKLEAGGMALQAQRQDLVGFLRTLTGAFESLARTHTLTLSFDAAADALPHAFDADKLEKVVFNLLSNAFKFTPAGGTITVRVRRDEDGAARITVSDTGQGIAADHLPYLFDRFYQGDGTATRRQEGTGIGLALAKELVTLHGGTISVASTVGEGTTFTVVLPAGPADASDEPAEALNETELGDGVASSQDLIFSVAASTAKPPLAPETPPDEDATIILVVEDNADMRAYLRTYLDADYHVVEADNGQVGLERARELVPDLIISDVMMPEMDGYAFSQAVKTDERTSHIPVVLLTARADEASRIEGLETGADDYLAKPFNAEELRVRVRNLIEQRRRLRKRFSGEVLVLSAREINVPSIDAAFLEKVQETIEANLDDTRFGVDMLADAAALSRRQLLRKLKALTGETPVELIRRIRLEHAAQLLRQDAVGVKEATHAAGFKSASHFRRAFREAYGVAPSEYGSAASATDETSPGPSSSQKDRSTSRKNRSGDDIIPAEPESGL